MSAFEIKNEIAEWEMLVNGLIKETNHLKAGEIITYDKISEIIGRPFKDSRTPIYRALRELQECHKRSLINVPNTGYRIPTAPEHEGLVKKRLGRAKRQTKKAFLESTSADRSFLSYYEAKRHSDMELNMQMLMDMEKRVNKRLRAVEIGVIDVRIGVAKANLKIDEKTENLDAKIDTKVENIESRLELILEKLKEHNIEI
jgi:hypothetical protein